MRRGWCSAEVGVELDDADNLGAGEVQGAGNERNGLVVDVTEGVLEGVEDGEAGAGEVLQAVHDGPGAHEIPCGEWLVSCHGCALLPRRC